MSTPSRILVVDDEPQILRALSTTLRGAGYEVQQAATGHDALAAVAVRPPDAVVLDLILPDLSGIEVCREIRRASDVPVIVLSAVGEERTKVDALDAGADDYVTKPFGVEELGARLRAVLRRVPHAPEPVVTLDDLTVDLDAQLVTRDGAPVSLTRTEFLLLRYLIENRGKLLTHRMILQKVWGPSYQVESHYLHVYVSRLRQKLEADPAHPRHLVTEPGAGYRLI
ncbi:MAG TPA: response regulator transcription factor [Gaiellales bacterium]|nr:response regulator transcription factor [Gaiellales bacterium]